MSQNHFLMRCIYTAALLFCIGLGANGYAQTAVDGAIGGTVEDANGAVIPNATILVHNNGTNAEFTTTSDSQGYFRVIHLQPAAYTVTVTASGFQTYKSSQTVVQVGVLTNFSPRLAVGSTSQTVEVSSDMPQMNTTSPDFAGVIDQHTLNNAPVNNYRWSSYSLLTPGVVNDSNGYGLLSFRGQSVLLNNVNVDGADDNQAFFSEERGRTRAGYSTAKASIQEFQVNTSNYSSEYGRSAGGVINSITKSGTNQLHGEAYFFDRDNDWGSYNDFAFITQKDANGKFVSNHYKPKDWRKQWGFGIGGPILKDKLFFYFAYDQYRHNFPGVGVPSNPSSFYALPDTTLPAGKVCGSTGATAPSAIDANTCTLAKNLNATPANPSPVITSSQYSAAATDWIDGINGLNSMLGTAPRTGDQTIFFPKVDWQINSKNHASFEVNRLRWISPAGIQTSNIVNYGIRSFGNDYVRDTWGIAKLDTLLTSSLSNEIRYSYGRDFEFEFGQAPTAYEQNNLLTTASGYSNPFGVPPNVYITGNFQFGLPTFLQRPAFPDERRYQISDTANWVRGNHNIKFGVDYIHTNDLSQNLRAQYGGFSYTSLANYFSDFYKPNGCLATVNGALSAAPCYSSYTQAFGTLGFEFQTGDYAIFAQDEWKVTPRLSLTYGGRYEYEKLPSPFKQLVNAAIPQTAVMPSDKNNIGPHVGFAYDVFGSGKTIVRGGYGLYYARIINATIYGALTNTGISAGQTSYSFTATTPNAPAFPQVLPSPTGSATSGAGANVIYFDKHFQTPQIHQLDMTVEQDLGWNTVFGISYLGTLGREFATFVDQNLAPSTSTITYNVVDTSGKGPLPAGGMYTTKFYSKVNTKNGRPNANFGAMTDIFSGVNSNYQALVFQLRHRMSHHVQFQANYTWSHALDFGENAIAGTSTNLLLDPTSIRENYGNSDNNVPNRLVVSAVAESPWKFTGWKGTLLNGYQIAPVYQAQNGLPYSLGTSGTPGSVTTSAGKQNSVGGGVNGSGGAFRIDILGRNTYTQPRTQTIDLRLSKHVDLGDRFKLELRGEAFNLANHQNVNSVQTTGYFISGNTLRFNTSSANAKLPLFGSVTSTNNSNFAYSTRQIQLGLDLKF